MPTIQQLVSGITAGDTPQIATDGTRVYWGEGEGAAAGIRYVAAGWGRNINGQLGNGWKNNYAKTPTGMEIRDHVLLTHAYGMCGAIMADRSTLWWGQNGAGQLPVDTGPEDQYAGFWQYRTGLRAQRLLEGEIQTLTVTGSPTGGTWRLKYGSEVSGVLKHNAKASEVETALEAIVALQGKFTVGGGPGPGTPWLVYLPGLSGIALLTITENLMTGGSSPTVTATKTQTAKTAEEVKAKEQAGTMPEVKEGTKVWTVTTGSRTNSLGQMNYPLGATVLHEGKVWVAKKATTGIEPGTDASVWSITSDVIKTFFNPTSKRYEPFFDNRSLPTPAPQLADSVLMVTWGGVHGLALRTNGQAVSWGYNRGGILGNGIDKSWGPKPRPLAPRQTFPYTFKGAIQSGSTTVTDITGIGIPHVNGGTLPSKLKKGALIVVPAPPAIPAGTEIVEYKEPTQETQGVSVSGSPTGGTFRLGFGQTITVTGSPTSGTFKLAYEGVETSALNWNAKAVDVEAALNAISALKGKVKVEGGAAPAKAFTIVIREAAVHPLFTLANNSLGGGSAPSVTIEATQSSTIKWNATAAEVKTALETIPGLKGAITVTAGPFPGEGMNVQWKDLRPVEDQGPQELLTLQDNKLTGGTSPKANTSRTSTGVKGTILLTAAAASPEPVGTNWTFNAVLAEVSFWNPPIHENPGWPAKALQGATKYVAVASGSGPTAEPSAMGLLPYTPPESGEGEGAGGEVDVWGTHATGQLADGTATSKEHMALVPQRVKLASGAVMKGIVAIACGEWTNYALTWDGKLYVWGKVEEGQAGTAPQEAKTKSTSKPILVEGLPTTKGERPCAVWATLHTTFVLLENGKVMAFGGNEHGELGRGTVAGKKSSTNKTPWDGKPTLVPGLVNVKYGSGGRYHWACVTTDGKLFTCGGNLDATIGDGTQNKNGSVDKPTPVEIYKSGAVAVACGEYNTFATLEGPTIPPIPLRARLVPAGEHEGEPQAFVKLRWRTKTPGILTGWNLVHWPQRTPVEEAETDARIAELESIIEEEESTAEERELAEEELAEIEALAEERESNLKTITAVTPTEIEPGVYEYLWEPPGPLTRQLGYFVNLQNPTHSTEWESLSIPSDFLWGSPFTFGNFNDAFTTASGLSEAHLDGTSQNLRFESPSSSAIATDGTYIYFTTGTGATGMKIGRCKADGTGIEPAWVNGKPEGREGQIVSMCVMSGSLYWLAYMNDTGEGPQPIIGRVALTGEGGGALQTTYCALRKGVPGSLLGPGYLTSDSHALYVAGQAHGGEAEEEGEHDSQFIAKVVKPVGGVLRVTPRWLKPDRTPSGIFADETFLYWRSLSGVGRVRLDGTSYSPTWLELPTYEPQAISIQGEYLYWVDSGGNTVNRVALGSIVEEHEVDEGLSSESAATPTEPRPIDPTSDWVRHIVRGDKGALSAMPLGRGYFVRADAEAQDGVNGPAGWQSAEVTDLLEDDGEAAILLPNGEGDDGILHRRRFSVLTVDDYEPGEEWLEFYRDSGELLYVATPTEATKTRQSVTVKSAAASALLAGYLSSELDVWDAAAPGDVIGHYSRMPIVALGEDLNLAETGGEGEWHTGFTAPFSGVEPDCWIAEVRLRWETPTTGKSESVRLTIGNIQMVVDVVSGKVIMEAGGLPDEALIGKRQGLTVPGQISLRVVVRYDQVFFLVNGEVVGEIRREQPWVAPTSLALAQKTIEGDPTKPAKYKVRGIHIETLLPFLGKDPTSISRRLAGEPTPEGLRAQYWSVADIFAAKKTWTARQGQFWNILNGGEPATDRIESTVSGDKLPANLPGAYAARWSGAIYLDLAKEDLELKLNGSGHYRAYVGKTLRGSALAGNWRSATLEPASVELTTGSLREQLGEESGWYSIVLEQAREGPRSPNNELGLSIGKVGGPYATAPTSILSPLGIYSDTIRYTTHRQVIGDVAAAFGYQWRIDPQSLESGKFPGVLVVSPRVGRSTSKVVEDDDTEAGAIEAQVQGVATDVVDGITADAAGIADPNGSGQLSAQIVDYARAGDHMSFRQLYESLSDITEAPLLQQRIDSELVLHSSPNEQVGVRPSGQRDLVDTLPLTGEIARFDWRPGDSLRLALASIDVNDLMPRQLASVNWQLRPDGIGALAVGFHVRPRDPRAALRRLRATVVAPRRTYQGGTGVLFGQMGGQTNTGGSVEGAVDSFSRVALPTQLANVKRAIFTVYRLEGSGWRMEIGGVDLEEAGLVNAPGRYDVTQWVRAANPVEPYITARLIGGTAGKYKAALEVWIKT